MYQFNYGYVKGKYKPSCFLQTQTVQLIILKQKMFMKIFKKTRSYFYFSGYPRDSKFFDLVNKNVIDKMKDEFKGNIVSEFDGLKSKMYYLVDVGGRGIKKAKGVNRSVVMGIMHKEFVGVLFGGE